jgi:hypothetical protein
VPGPGGLALFFLRSLRARRTREEHVDRNQEQ